MKSNKGVTLTSLIIYVVGLMVVTAIIGTFTGFFYKNVETILIEQSAQEQYTKLLSYITKDVSSNNLISVQTGVNEQDSIIFRFSDGYEHQYIYKNGIIYYINTDTENEKKITLCRNILTETGSVFNYIDGILNIRVNIDNQNFSSSLNVNV